MFFNWLPRWAWILIYRHLKGVHSRPAIKWMNLFAFLGVMVGIFSWTTVVSTMRGLQNERRERVLKQKPHLLWESSPSPDVLQQKEKMIKLLGEQLYKIDFLLQTEGLIEVAALGQSGRISGSGVIVQGLDNDSTGVQMGIELFEDFRLDENSKVKLHNVWRLDLPPQELKITSTFSTGIYEIDRSTLRMPRSQIENWLGIKNSISRIEIQLKDPYQAEKFVDVLNRESGLQFKSWKEMDSSLWYSLKLEMLVITIAIFFVVLIASFSVHMALSVRVVDKSREIALLRALGADDKILARLYLTEAVVLGSLGAFSGLFLAYFFCKGISSWWTLPSIYYYTQLPIDWNWGLNGVLTVIAIFLAAFAGWWPSRKVRLIEIQEGLRS